MNKEMDEEALGPLEEKRNEFVNLAEQPDYQEILNQKIEDLKKILGDKYNEHRLKIIAAVCVGAAIAGTLAVKKMKKRTKEKNLQVSLPESDV